MSIRIGDIDICNVFVLHCTFLNVKIERQNVTGGVAKTTFGSKTFWLKLRVL